jgi:hypothetical protein
LLKPASVIRPRTPIDLVPKADCMVIAAGATRRPLSQQGEPTRRIEMPRSNDHRTGSAPLSRHLRLRRGEARGVATKDGDSMNSSDFKPAFATAAETANAVRNRRISATELLNLEFQRIDRYNPKLNAIVWQDRDRALACAKQADASLAGGKSTGALHGVPITIKESFAYRGSPNTWGLPALKNAISPRTAVAIQRLESAGATVLGKTNVSTMLADWQSYNPIYGASNNPWDLAFTPGGSTGGGAAALAAGLGCLTVGSDLSFGDGPARTECCRSGLEPKRPWWSQRRGGQSVDLALARTPPHPPERFSSRLRFR